MYRKRIGSALVLAILTFATACAEPEVASLTAEQAEEAGVVQYDTSPEQTDRPREEAVPEIAALVPEPWRTRGSLVVGGTAGSNPPLNFFAEDNTTAVGVERDIGLLVADVLDLEYIPEITSWENLFVGLDSGRIDIGLSNITVTEERKEKYDFATYRKNLMSFESRADSELQIASPADISGATIATSSGTIQEDLLLRWNQANLAEGLEPAEIVYYQDAQQYYLAVESGRIDAYLGPNPTAKYHVAISGKTKIVGTVNPGDAVEAEVGVTTRQDSGLAEPAAAALNYLIDSGAYQRALDRWGVGQEAVAESHVNPAGIPRQQR